MTPVLACARMCRVQGAKLPAQGGSSIGRAAVSKTAGCRCKSCHPCDRSLKRERQRRASRRVPRPTRAGGRSHAEGTTTTEDGEGDMARKRPGDDAAGDRPDDEVFDEEAVADEPDEDIVEDGDPVGRGGGTAVRERKAGFGSSKAKREVRRTGLF